MSGYIVLAAGVFAIGATFGAAIAGVAGFAGASAAISLIGAKVGAFVLYALPKAVTVITIQLVSGFTGIGLDGSTLSKDAAQSRIQNGFANLTATSIGFGLYQLAQTNNYGNVQGSNQSSGNIIKSKDIKYTQDSISSKFSDGTTVEDTINGLKNGTVDPKSIPEVRIFEKDGQIFSLDNRRLYAFKEAGINDIPYRWAKL